MIDFQLFGMKEDEDERCSLLGSSAKGETGLEGHRPRRLLSYDLSTFTGSDVIFCV